MADKVSSIGYVDYMHLATSIKDINKSSQRNQNRFYFKKKLQNIYKYLDKYKVS